MRSTTVNLRLGRGGCITPSRPSRVRFPFLFGPFQPLFRAESSTPPPAKPPNSISNANKSTYTRVLLDFRQWALDRVTWTNLPSTPRIGSRAKNLRVFASHRGLSSSIPIVSEIERSCVIFELEVPCAKVKHTSGANGHSSNAFTNTAQSFTVISRTGVLGLMRWSSAPPGIAIFFKRA